MRTHILCLMPCIFSFSALAHHSRAEFTGDVIELEGELLEVDWRNPHPSFKLRVSETSTDTWEIQVFGAFAWLGRVGIDASLFTVGERITVAGLASSRRENLLLGSHVLLPSGFEAVLQYNASPHWSGDYIGGSGAESVDEGVLAKAAAENRGLFRVWSIPTTETAVAAFSAVEPVFTDAALAARASWDVTDNPMTRCEEPWMPTVMLTPTAREFIDNGDTLTLRIAYLRGGSRTIYLRDAPDGLDGPRTRMGRSVGRWEGNTLIVETDLIEAPTFYPDGTSQSPEMKVTERFTLSDDQSHLDYEAIMQDPVALHEPATFRLHYLALGEEFVEQCR